MPEVSHKPSIVITGTGFVCGLGADAETVWRNVLAGKRGIGPMPEMESPLPAGSDGGQAVDLLADYEPTLPREARYLRYAIQQALKQAGDISYDPKRRAVMLGTTLHGMRAAGRFLRTGDYDQLRDFLAGDIATRATHGLGLHGQSATTCSACSSGLGAIALAMTLLRTGAADVVIAGGYDPISEYAWAGFNALRLVSGPPLRPFTKGRVGMKVAEAYAVVVLERASDAQQRGAKAIATIAGYGESADAHHLTQPHPQGLGASTAMTRAIAEAHLTPADIGLISAHATGTPDNDSAEFAAMSQAFGDRLPVVPVVAYKGHLGHTLGGAGAGELILSALALRDGLIPPTVLDANEELEFPSLRLNRGTPQSSVFTATLNTSLGFGGANTSVVLTRSQGPMSTPAISIESLAQSPRGNDLRDASAQATRQVVLTGLGIVLPGAYDLASFRDVLSGSKSFDLTMDLAHVESILNARRTRRMSDYVKITLAAATLAARNAFGSDASSGSIPTDTAALLGTMHGSSNFAEQYYRQLITEGAGAANPSLFAEGVPNAAAAQLSLMLGLTGPCQTILGTVTAGLDALRLAMLRIASGEWNCCVVSAAEEDSALIAAAYAHCGHRADQTAGAIAFILEDADTAAARGATVLATLTHAAAASGMDAIRGAVQSMPQADRRVFAEQVPAVSHRFSVTPLAAMVAEIEAGGSFVLVSSDKSNASAVRVMAGA